MAGTLKVEAMFVTETFKIQHNMTEKCYTKIIILSILVFFIDLYY